MGIQSDDVKPRVVIHTETEQMLVVIKTEEDDPETHVDYLYKSGRGKDDNRALKAPFERSRCKMSTFLKKCANGRILPGTEFNGYHYETLEKALAKVQTD